jgi:hypothetical protein
MTTLHGEFNRVTDARDRVRRRLAWLAREGFEVDQLDPYTWEVNTDGLVSGHCGILRVRRGPAHIQ